MGRLLMRVCLATLALFAAVAPSAPPTLAQDRDPPQNITVERVLTARQVIVRWASAAGVPTTHFHVWRGAAGASPTAMGLVGLVQSLPGTTDHSVTISVPAGVSSTHVYRVRSLDEGDTGNNSGWSGEVGLRDAETIPAAVEVEGAPAVSAASITVTWENVAQPSDGDAVAHRHVYIRHKPRGGGLQEPGSPCATVAPSVTTAVCAIPGNLDSASDAHEIWVVTEDVWGDRAASTPAPFLAGRPSAPRNPQAVVCRNTISMLWDEPSSMGSSEFFGYELRMKVGDDLGFTALPRRVFVTSFTDIGLATRASHTYQVRAHNRDGPGPWSAEVTASTSAAGLPGEGPGRPRDFDADLSSGFAELTWGTPTGEGGCGIVGYRVERKVANQPFERLADIGLATTFLDFTVESGMYYSYRVAAVSGNGAGLWARTFAQVAPMPPSTESPPPKPLRLRLTPGPANSNPLLEWDPPTEGDAAITGYVIARRADFSRPADFVVGDVVASVSSATFEWRDSITLTDGSHDYRVRAIGQGGRSGAWSDIARFASPPRPPTPENPPSKPLRFRLTPDSGRAALLLEWDPPSEGDAAITSYVIARRADFSRPADFTESDVVASVSSGTSEWRDSSPPRDRSHDYRVRAIDQDGRPGAWSDIAQFDYQADIPAPNAVRNPFLGRRGVSIYVSWEDASQPAGTPDISRHRVLFANILTECRIVRSNYAACRIPSGSVVTAAYVRTENVWGKLADSAQLTFHTAPSAPLDVQAYVCHGRARVMWTPPYNGTARVTAYQLVVDGDQASPVDLSEVQSHTLENLSAGAHTVSIRGRNRHGFGPAGSVTFTAFASQRSVPGAPRNPRMTIGTYSNRVTWDPPAADSECALSHYSVSRKDGNGEFITRVDDLGINETGWGHPTNVGTEYTYRIYAHNLDGRSQPLEHGPVSLPTADLVPRNLTVALGSETVRRVSLSWEEPAYGTPNSYVIRYADADNRSAPPVTVGTVPGTVRGATVDLESVPYNRKYSVKALFQARESDWSEGFTFDFEAEPSGVANLRVAGLTSLRDATNTITLEWDNVAQPAGGTAITAHQVKRSIRHSSDVVRLQRCTSTPRIDGALTSTICTYPALDEIDLATGFNHFQVESFDLWANESAPVVLTVLLGRPSAPRDLRADTCSTGAKLSWKPPADDRGSPVTGYEVERRGSHLRVLTAGLRATTHMSTLLDPDVPYTYRVRARNAHGHGDWSPEIEARTGSAGAVAPSAPRNIGVAFRSGQAVIDWDPPANDGGCPVRSYVVERQVDGGTFERLATVEGTGHTDAGSFAAGSRYAYRVRALNIFGGSPSAESAPATTSQLEQNSLSLVPQDVRAASDGTGETGQVRVFWSHPPSDAPFDHYVVGRWPAGVFESDPDSGAFFPWHPPTTRSVLMRDATLHHVTGNTIEYRVRVVMPDGTAGAWSLPAVFAKEDTTPPSPVANVRARQTEAGVFEVRWDPVAQPPGERVTRNEIVATLLGPGGTPAPGSEVTCALSAVDGPARCRFTPASVDSRSEGHRIAVRSTDFWHNTSDSEPARLLLGRPLPPRNFRVGVCRDTARVDWDPPAPGGQPGPFRYELQRKAAGGEFVSAASASDATEHTDRSLPPVTEHTYRVRTSNANGFGEWSDEVRVTTGAAGAPTAPERPEALTVDVQLGANRLGWDHPSGGGGCQIAAYRIERQVGRLGDFAVLETVAASVTSFLDRDIGGDTRHRYRVVAVAPGAESEAAGPVSAFREAQLVARAEAVPGNLTATRDTLARRINLAWAVPASGVPASAYVAEHWETLSPDSRTTTNVSGNRTTLTIPLFNDFLKTWVSRVRAVDIAGVTSAWSAPVTFRYEDPTPPLPVANPRIAARTGTQVKVAWDNVRQGAGEPDIIEHRLVFSQFDETTGAAYDLLGCTGVARVTMIECPLHFSPDAAFTERNAIFVRSRDVWGKEVDSEPVPFLAGRPGPPLNLQAEACSTRASLSWEVPAYSLWREVVGYEVHRKVGSGAYALAHKAPATRVGHVDDALRPNTTHTYRVRALNAAGPGEWSEARAVIAGSAGGVAPGAPRNPRVSASPGGFTVAWEPPASEGGCPPGYRIERQVGTGDFEALATLGAASTTHIDSVVTAGSDHTYRIVAVNPYGEASVTVAAGIPSATSAQWAVSMGFGDGFLPVARAAQGDAGSVTLTVRAEGVIHESGRNIRRLIIVAGAEPLTARLVERTPGAGPVTLASSRASCTYTGKDGSGAVEFTHKRGPDLEHHDEADTNELFLVRCEYPVTLPLSGAQAGEVRTYELEMFANASGRRATNLQVRGYSDGVNQGNPVLERVRMARDFTEADAGTVTVRVVPDASHAAWGPASLGVTAGADNAGTGVLAGESVLLSLGDIGFSYTEPVPRTAITSLSALERQGRVPVTVGEVDGAGPVFMREGFADRLASFPLPEASFSAFPSTGTFSGTMPVSAPTLTLSVPAGTPAGEYEVTVSPAGLPAELRARVNGADTGFVALAPLVSTLTVVADEAPVFAAAEPLSVAVSQAVSRQLPQASGGNGTLSHSYTSSWDSGLGLSVGEDGLLSGTPVSAGVFSVTIVATDNEAAFLGHQVPGHVANPDDSATLVQVVGVGGASLRTQASLADPVEEGESASVPVHVTPAVGSELTVGFELLGGDGEASEDASVASAVSGAFVVPAGTATHMLTLDVSDDALSEGAEVVTVRLTGVSNADFPAGGLAAVSTPSTAQVTVAASDALTAGLSGPAELAEGSSGTYRVTVAGGVSTDTVTVDIAVSGDPAHYSSALTQAVVAPGESFLEFAVTATDNELDDEDKTFTVSLSNPSGGGGGGISLDPSAVSVSTAIADDDVPTIEVSFGSGSYTATEGGAPATVTVSLSVAPEREVSIPITVAMLDGEGVPSEGVLATHAVFGADSTSETLEMAAADDSDDDDGEVQVVGFGAELPDPIVPGAQSTFLLTLVDNDPAIEVSFGAGPHTATEGGAAATVSLSLSAAPAQELVLPVTVSAFGGGAAAGDVSFAEVTFAVSATVSSVTVEAVDDPDDDDGESVTLGLDAAALPNVPNRIVAGAPATAVVSLADDDDPEISVSFGAGPHTAAEGGEPATVTVSLSAAPEREVTVPVSISTVGGVGEPSSTVTNLVFAADQLTADIVVAAAEDDADDDEERARLEFGAPLPTRVTAAAPSVAVVTLADNDFPEIGVSFAAGPHTATENGADAEVGVTLSAAPERAVTVPITVSYQGGASEDDVSFADAVFAADATVATVTVEAFDDLFDDDGESVSLGFGPLPERVTAAGVTSAAVALADDDVAVSGVSLAVSPSALAESAGGTDVVVTASLVGDSVLQEALDVSLTLAGTSTGGADYTAPSVLPVATIPAGRSSVSVSLTLDPQADGVVEGDETVVVEASAAGHTVSPASLALTDTDTAGLSIGTEVASASEGGAVEFGVSIDSGTAEAVTVPWSVSSGAEEVAEADRSGSVTFAAGTSGASTVTLTVHVADDSLSEGAEGFAVSLGAPRVPAALGGRVSVASATVSVGIAASDPLTLSLSGPASVAEGSAATYTVSVSGGESTEGIVVDVSVSAAGSASASDHGTGPSTLSLSRGRSSATFSVTTAANYVDDDGKLLAVSISNPQGGGGGGVSVATGGGGGLSASSSDGGVTTAIADDDETFDVTVSFAGGSVTATEGGTDATVTVSLDRAPGRPLSVPLTFSLSGGASAADHTGVPGSVAFAPNATSATFVVSAADDTLEESAGEAVLIGFGVLPERVLAGSLSVAGVTIVDNDIPSTHVSLSLSRAAVGEGDSAIIDVAVTARLDGSVVRAAPLTVPLSVGTAGTATAGADYLLGRLPSLVIPAGALSVSGEFAVTPLNDRVVEAGEGIDLTASIAGHTVTPATLSVTDDDTAEVSVAGPASAASEGAGAVFTVSLSRSVAAAVTVSLSTSDGTATEAGGDYAARSGASATVVFGALSAAGATRPFTVSVLNDTVSEAAERLTLSAVSATTALGAGKVSVGADAEAGASIAANDPLSLSLSGPATVAEGATSADYTLSLSGPHTPQGAVVVSLTTSGSAAAGVDHSVPGSVTIPSGQSSALFSIEALADDIDDDDETVVVGIGDLVSGGSGLTPSSRAASVETTIADDDDPFVTAAFVAAERSAAEGGGAATVTVTLDADPERAVTYPLTATPQGGARASDFSAPASVSFAAGSTLATFTVAAADDRFHEPGAEGVSLALGAPQGDARALVGSPAGASVALSDNDGPAQTRVSLSATSPALREGDGDAVIRVTGTLAGTTALEADLSVALTLAGDTTAAHSASGSTLPTLVIGAGAFSGSASATVALTDDATVGPDTEIVLGGRLPGYTVGTVRIGVSEDDSATVTVTWAAPAEGAGVAEGDDAEFDFTLDAPVAANVRLPWSLELAGGVTRGDFSGAVSGTVSFGSGNRSPAGTRRIRVRVADDRLFEGREAATLSLGALTVSDASLSARVSSTASSVGFTVAADASDRSTVAISGPAETFYILVGSGRERHRDVLEGQAATFTLSLSGGSALADIVVPLSAGGAGHSAQAADFSLPAAPVTLSAGTRATTFEVAVSADSVLDAGEIVAVALGTPSGGAPGAAAAPALGGVSVATVTVVEANSAPSFGARTVTLSVTENAPAGNAVGAALRATDTDAADTLSYALAGGSLFGIVAGSGQVTVAAGAALDFETRARHTVTASVRDGRDYRGIADTVADASVAVVVTLGDEAMPPPASVTVSGEVDSLVVEWQAPSTTISVSGYEVAHRPSGDTGTHTTVSTAATSVTIAGLARESEHEVRVVARGGEGNSIPVSVSGTVPANNAPAYASAGATLTVPENSPAGTAIGAVQSATDADGDPLTYGMAGIGSSLFTVDANGQIRVGTGTDLDHETAATHRVSLVAADAVVSATLVVTISVTDVDEPPDPPVSLTVSAPDVGGDTRLNITWDAPDDITRPAISGFAVEYRATSDTDGAFVTTGVTLAEAGGTAATITGLDLETDYDVRVRTSNDEGDSGWANAQGRTTPVLNFRLAPRLASDPGRALHYNEAMLLYYSMSQGAFLLANPDSLRTIFIRLLQPGGFRTDLSDEELAAIVRRGQRLGEIVPATHPANLIRSDGSGFNSADALFIFYSLRFGNFLLANLKLARLNLSEKAGVDVTLDEAAAIIRAGMALADIL